MKRVPLVSSILISAVLVIGALWVRFGSTNYVLATITSVNGGEAANQQDIQDFLPDPNKSEGAIFPSGPLTFTDSIGRNLFSDYISLKSQGEVSPLNLQELANKYGDIIPSSTISPRADLSRIITASESPQNFTAYNTAVNNLRNKYAASISSSFSQGNFSDLNSPDFINLMKNAGKLYAQAVNELYSIPAPKSLAGIHAKLIENYLSTAEAVKVLSSPDADPLYMLAALNTFAKNSQAEEGILSSIQIAVLRSL